MTAASLRDKVQKSSPDTLSMTLFVVMPIISQQDQRVLEVSHNVLLLLALHFLLFSAIQPSGQYRSGFQLKFFVICNTRVLLFQQNLTVAQVKFSGAVWLSQTIHVLKFLPFMVKALWLYDRPWRLGLPNKVIFIFSPSLCHSSKRLLYKLLKRLMLSVLILYCYNGLLVMCCRLYCYRWWWIKQPELK